MKKLILTLFLAFTFLFVGISHASAATLYFNGGVNHNWNTRIGNWWTDSGFTLQAPSLPTVSDDVIISNYIDTNSGPAASVNSLVLNQGNSTNTNIPITVANGATFNTHTYNRNIINGNVIFNGTGQNYGGTINGNAVFNNTSSNDGSGSGHTATINGNATFNDTTINLGTITGNATYNFGHAGVITMVGGTRWGNGTVGGSILGDDTLPITSWVFNADSYNGGIVSGDATFNETSFNSGTVTGDASFHDSSSNYNTISGNATFNDLSFNQGTISGDAIFNYAYDGVITIPDGISWAGAINGSILGEDELPVTSWVFNSNSANNTTILGNVTFNNTSQNNSTVSGDASFFNSSVNYGTVSGDANFYGDLSENNGTISGIKTRSYTTDLTTDRNFITDGPWTVAADGATVNIFYATYDETTTFETLNGGSFIYTQPDPNILVVNSLLDDGDGTCAEDYCTFRDAIINAIDGDVIEFDEDVTGTIVLDANEAIYVDYNITVTGPGSDVLTLDFNDNWSNFISFGNDGEVNISGLTFTNAPSNVLYEGGGDDSVYNISDSVFTNNTDNEPVYASYGDWNFTNVTFSNNDTCDYGGAIYFESEGDLTINNSTFTDNVSCDYGGAIYFDSNGNLIINNSSFSNNYGESGGGAIYAYGNNSSDYGLTITNSTFSENSTDGYEGSAIYVDDGSDFYLTIENSTFYNNTSDGYETIYYYEDGIVTITNSTFYDDINSSDYHLYSYTVPILNNNIFYSSSNYNCYDSGYYSGGHNIDSGDSCGFNQEGDLVNQSGYEVLHDFDGENGYNPGFTLLEDSGKFYGTTYGGGIDDDGVLFEYDPALDSYNILHDFDFETGNYPSGFLIEYDNKLYGMTSYGGADDDGGVIFEYDPSLDSYIVLHDFDFETGNYPYGSLIVHDNKFYGMTSYGGADDNGVIFEYDPSEDAYSVLQEFDIVSGSYNSLIEYNNKFYGMVGGYGDDHGIIFQYDPADVGNEYTVLHEFNGDDGSHPWEHDLLVYNDKLYGMTYEGGANDGGVIFEYDLSEEIYTVLYDFSEETGWLSQASLIDIDGNLYGTTFEGGSYGFGVIFKFNPTEESYTVLHEFDESNGKAPWGRLLEYNDKLYGMTYEGGVDGYGTIFSFDPSFSLFDPSGLADNGGPVQTIALAEGSIAIDAGDDDSASDTDQRGYTRAGRSDIGAFEYNGGEPEQTCEDGTEVPADEVCAPQTPPQVASSGSSSTHRVNTPAKQALPNTPPATPPTIPNPAPSSGPSNPLVFKSPNNFKPGTTSEDIKELQKYLNTHGFPVSLAGPGSLGLETNYFGPKTKAAVILFQKSKGLVPDGIVGPKTKGKMI
jgi:uncharacterized repeat protein (TIGR03803 family)/predicted outer membrane repeat protein